MTTAGGRLSAFAKSRWFKLVWIVPAVLVALFLLVLAARGIRALPAVQSFMTDFPGATTLPAGAPVGFPAWLAWQHGLNAFFILFIIRSGWQVRTVKRPTMFWKRNNSGIIRTKNPPTKISLNLWLHLSFDTLWVLNGLLFYVLIFSTGQWLRIVPVSWSVFPNAVSAAIQYASFDWPVESGWVNYNALQLITYFVVVFIAAPLALLTGLRMSPAWKSKRLSAAYPIGVARAVHYPVMLFFVAFIIVHVILVFATGILRNLNHMYAVRNDESWLGFGIFAGTVVLMTVAWFAAQPVVLRSIASLTGSVTR
ncbi:cytochrome b/b6 domain-containing protein [Lacisediminihabitans sp.]|uniref:cytochrome b/b6 domain-containing protein n=1 Tax=Lacisediminihabitans sp. TaxID=2787631 RepID=UPI00374D0CAB